MWCGVDSVMLYWDEILLMVGVAPPMHLHMRFTIEFVVYLLQAR